MLKKVKLGRNVESIQVKVFRKCVSLTLITFPEKVRLVI